MYIDEKIRLLYDFLFTFVYLIFISRFARKFIHVNNKSAIFFTGVISGDAVCYQVQICAHD